jgi:hypothetical protein
MSRMDPQQKAIANVILDLVAAVDVSGENELPDGWMSPFAVRLSELDAVPITDDGEEVGVNVTPLVTSAALLTNVLIDVIADINGADRLAVVRTVREHIERNL